MNMTTRSASGALLTFTLLALAAMPARASLFSLAASGTINSSADPAAIPVGTPWTFKLTYDTAAPDLDFEFLGSPDPTFGRFKNTAAPPAIIFFQFQAGSYEVTIDDPADFGAFSEVLITFTTVNAIDINIHAPASFPPLAGGPVSFHADFNAFSMAPILSSDGLPTNTAISLASFDQNTVTLIPPTGVVTSSALTSLTLTSPPTGGDFDEDGQVNGNDLARWRTGFGAGTTHMQGDADADHDVDGADFLTWQRQLGITSLPPSTTAVPEPSTAALQIVGLLVLLDLRRRPN